MMYTNGTLITADVAGRMAQLGNVTPAISVEGFERETDERRGKGTFRKIEKAMENLRRAGVPFGVSMTATRDNAHLVLSDELIRHYFKGQGAFYGWVFQYMPIGRSYTLDMMITPQQRLAMFHREQEVVNNQGLFLVDFWNGGLLAWVHFRRQALFLYRLDGNIARASSFHIIYPRSTDITRKQKTSKLMFFFHLFSNPFENGRMITANPNLPKRLTT